jgi:hypothetical protein
MRANKLKDRCHFIAGITRRLFFGKKTSEQFTTGNLRTYVEFGTRARDGSSYGGQSLFTIDLLKHMRGFLSPRAHFDGRRVSSELILVTPALRQQS